jgi:hypothetical protein
MSKFFNILNQVFYILAIVSIFYSIHVYQTDATRGIFIGLWVPTLLLLGPACPLDSGCRLFSSSDQHVRGASETKTNL